MLNSLLDLFKKCKNEVCEVNISSSNDGNNFSICDYIHEFSYEEYSNKLKLQFDNDGLWLEIRPTVILKIDDYNYKIYDTNDRMYEIEIII